MTNLMEGKRVLITGGNSGIGKTTAIGLARMGAEVIIACRESAKTSAALEEISQASGQRVVNLPVNLASLKSVRDLAAAFHARFDKLSVLINNAGVFPTRLGLTDDGFEMQFGVNHLAHFLLTNLMSDVLKESAPARIVTVSSMMHKKGVIDFNSFRGETKYGMQAAYAQSKLANVLFSVELADRLRGTGVTSNALHPGGVRTDITRDVPWLLRKLIDLVFISPEAGARTSVMLASDPELMSTSAQYFDQMKLTDPSPLVADAALRTRLWLESAQLTSIDPFREEYFVAPDSV